jgi:hypothetical protein
MATQTSIVIADAKTLVTTVNNNPVSYTHKFQRPLRDVSKISLMRSSIPRSQIITLIVVSDWVASGTALVGTSDFHQIAVRMAAAIGSNANTSGYVAAITNPAGTVDLRVYDVYTRTAARDNGDYKTYDVLICTGSVLTSTFTDWTITAEAEAVVTSSITPTTASVLTVDIAHQPAVLRVRLNGDMGVGRVEQANIIQTIWMSYKMYYPGDIVNYGTAKYVCTIKHLSILFNTDSAAFYWSNMATTGWVTSTAYVAGNQIEYGGSIYVCLTAHTSGSFGTDLNALKWTWGSHVPAVVAAQPPAANDAFEVFYFDTDSQTTSTAVYLPEHIQQTLKLPMLRSISFEWVQRNGQPFIFPYIPRIQVTSLESSSSYTFERDYPGTCLHLQLTHSAYWQ